MRAAECLYHAAKSKKMPSGMQLSSLGPDTPVDVRNSVAVAQR